MVTSRGDLRLVTGLAVILALVSLWACAATWFLVFRDDLLVRVATRQGAMQTAYDARVDELQAEAARASVEHVQTRDGIESRIAKLMERQALIEKRQAIVERLGDGPATTGSITPPAQAPSSTPAPSTQPLELRTDLGGRTEAASASSILDLAILEIRLNESAAQLTRTLNAIELSATHSTERYRSLIRQAGIDPSRMTGYERGKGGPLVPIAGDAFDVARARAESSKEDEERVRRSVAALPLRQPLREEFSLSSNFGPRVDPFTRGLAQHTGLDLRTDHGAAARATASGRVTAAEYAGGYDNMVEIDHGHGLVTRYAHLASITVILGQRVAAGAVVGRVGSTGRSTGPHLHYETRIDGEPVDPEPFLRAGEQLVFPD